MKNLHVSNLRMISILGLVLIVILAILAYLLQLGNGNKTVVETNPIPKEIEFFGKNYTYNKYQIYNNNANAPTIMVGETLE